MADIDMVRAKKLLKSSEDLFKQDDMAGVAGLAYQAFESAVIALGKQVNGMDSGTHAKRRNRVKELINKHQQSIDLLWEKRNIDFYGNVNIGEEKKELSKEEIEETLNTIKNIIKEIEMILDKKTI